MKTLKLFAVALVAMCLASCGGDSNSVTLKVEPQLGELGKYISLNDQEIVVTLSDETKDSTAVKTIASSLAFTVNKAFMTDESLGADFEVHVLDKNHNEIGKLPRFCVDVKSDFGKDYSYSLSAGPNRAQMKHSDKAEEWKDEDQEMWDKICSEGVYVVITPYSTGAKYLGQGILSNASVEDIDAVGDTDVVDF